MKDCLSIANIEGNINRTFESVLHLNAGVTNYSMRQIVPQISILTRKWRSEVRSSKFEVRNKETASTK